MVKISMETLGQSLGIIIDESSGEKLLNSYSGNHLFM